MMQRKQKTKSVREGNYLAEVNVELIESTESWSPYLTLEDTYKLDDVREALQKEDIKKASKLAKVYYLKPVAS